MSASTYLIVKLTVAPCRKSDFQHVLECRITQEDARMPTDQSESIAALVGMQKNGAAFVDARNASEEHWQPVEFMACSCGEGYITRTTRQVS